MVTDDLLSQYAAALEQWAASAETSQQHLAEQGKLLLTDRQRLLKACQQLQEQLDLARQSALDAKQEARDFLGSADHELRTAMAGVIGMIELLMQTGLSAEQQKYCEVLQASAASLLALLRDLIDAASIGTGSLHLDPVVFDIADELQQTVAVLRGLATERGIVLRLELADEMPQVLGDVARLRQILYNLIGGAIRATSVGGVLISAGCREVENGRMMLCVRIDDNGHNAEAPPANVTDISRQIIEFMGGSLETENLPQGRACWFELPIKPVHTAQGGNSGGASPPGTGLRVLVAEDNATNQLLVRVGLEKLGHEVAVVPNGRLAVEAVAREQYDLVLMDMQMPDTDGIEATRLIRALGGQAGAVPIIGLTAGAIAEQRAKYEAIGLEHVLPKPVDWALLTRIITQVTAPARAEPAGAVDDLPELVDEVALETVRKLAGKEWPGLQSLIVGNLEKHLHTLQATRQNHDFDTARRAAHSLKGSAPNYGLLRVGELARRLELALDGEVLDETELRRLETAIPISIAALGEGAEGHASAQPLRSSPPGHPVWVVSQDGKFQAHIAELLQPLSGPWKAWPLRPDGSEAALPAAEAVVIDGRDGQAISWLLGFYSSVERSGVPCLALVAAADDQARREAVAAGAHAFADPDLSDSELRFHLANLLALATRQHETHDELARMRKETQGLQQELARRQVLEDELRRMVATDALTGAYTRRHFLDVARRETRRADRSGTPPAILLMDIDHFKRINDTYGHAAGDDALRRFVQVCRRTLRDTDVLGRLGGEEFAALLPETDLATATQVAERLRTAVAKAQVVAEAGSFYMTASFGVTVYHSGNENIEQSLSRADHAMYTAKAEGRNRVEPIA